MPAPPISPRQTDGWLEPGPQNALVIYILYLVGFVIGITAIVGIVMAYLNRGKAGGFVESHYTWQIRTFWIALLASFVSALLFIVGIGVLLMLAVAAHRRKSQIFLCEPATGGSLSHRSWS